MPAPSPTISIRLPADARARLDKATAKTRRSRSYLMQRALELHLDEIERAETPMPLKGKLTGILALAGAGVDSKNPPTIEEIDEHIRWLRDHD